MLWKGMQMFSPFKYQRKKFVVFRWIQMSGVQYLDPHCTWLNCWDWCLNFIPNTHQRWCVRWVRGQVGWLNQFKKCKKLLSLKKFKSILGGRAYLSAKVPTLYLPIWIDYCQVPHSFLSLTSFSSQTSQSIKSVKFEPILSVKLHLAFLFNINFFFLHWDFKP